RHDVDARGGLARQESCATRRRCNREPLSDQRHTLRAQPDSRRCKYASWRTSVVPCIPRREPSLFLSTAERAGRTGGLRGSREPRSTMKEILLLDTLERSLAVSMKRVSHASRTLLVPILVIGCLVGRLSAQAPESQNRSWDIGIWAAGATG